MDDVRIIQVWVTYIAAGLAFYALIARESKTPSIVYSAYRFALFVFLAMFGLSALVGVLAYIHYRYVEKSVSIQLCLSLALVPLSLGVLLNVLGEYYRKTYLRTDGFKEQLLRLVRFVTRNTKIEQRNAKFEGSLKDALLQSPFLKPEPLQRAFDWQTSFEGRSVSVVAVTDGLEYSNNLTIDIALRFLKNDATVFYLTCVRHPSEFVKFVRAKLNEEKLDGEKKVQGHVYVVDAYSPHFGFHELIHRRLTKETKGAVREMSTSKLSYAGIHTALVKIYKHADYGPKNLPALVIYEGCFDLVDLENAEQYRTFVRHVLPSERIWGGMMTLFVETLTDEQSLAVLRASADVFLDARTNTVAGARQGNNHKAKASKYPQRSS